MSNSDKRLADSESDEEDMSDSSDEPEVGEDDGSVSEDSQNESSEDEDDADAEMDRTEIRKELSTLSFEELEALKTRIGTKEWNEAMFGTSSKPSRALTKIIRKGKKDEHIKRKNKHRPRELSSKIKVAKVRKDVPVFHKKMSRDPRFESLCGQYDEKIWEQNYEFIGDLRKKEIDELKEKLKSETDPGKKMDLKRVLQKMVTSEKTKDIKREKDKRANDEKESNIQRLKEGKKPYYMKKSTKKYVELVDKYEQLKESGKLEAYLKKKRKKNASRDSKALPSSST